MCCENIYYEEVSKKKKELLKAKRKYPKNSNEQQVFKELDDLLDGTNEGRKAFIEEWDKNSELFL